MSGEKKRTREVFFKEELKYEKYKTRKFNKGQKNNSH